MSKYTTELRYPLLQGFKIGLDKYPIFNEDYRETLNKKIINHFFFREIGFSTWERFVFALNMRMEEIMPYYNKLYEYNFEDFLKNVDITITEDNVYDKTLDMSQKGSAEINSENTSSSLGTDKQVFSSTDTAESKGIQSDTPMGSLNDIFSENYATGTSQQKADSNSSANQDAEHQSETSTKDTTNRSTDSTLNQTGKDNENKNIHRFGYERDKSLGEILLEYKDLFFNIDMQIISDLEPLFMGIW